ncbi:MAG: class I SAM-dependent methyltransferase [Gemmataceae bacterium]
MNSGQPTLLIDLGCGPGTAALAFADHYGAAFHYHGFDRSSAMRSTAHALLQQARHFGLINNASEITVTSGTFDPMTVQNTSPTPVNIIFVASYLFASKSLDAVSLARSLRTIIPLTHVQSAAFLYLNSRTKFANRTYEQFIHELGPIERLRAEEQVIHYRRYAGRTAGRARFVNDCLILKDPVS